jgi:small-conductance mechanosensitive channel
MKNRLMIIGLLLICTVGFWLLHVQFSQDYFTKLFYTALALSITYIIFDLAIQQMITMRIKDDKTRYSLKKITSIVYLLSLIATVLTIWVNNLGALLVSYGIMAAVAAFALQDFFKNFAGGVSIFFTGIYRVGDRIEINSKIGDVIDIGVLYTTLLETNEWVKGDQATGRLSIVPNSFVLTGVINNYTKDHPYIWDEILIPITYDSDWKAALRVIDKVVEVETREDTQESEISISKLTDKYYLPKRSTGPTIYISLTDNWIALNVRYITAVRQRRIVKDKLNREILLELESTNNVKIASATMQITIVK